jgi:hypothetical protein
MQSWVIAWADIGISDTGIRVRIRIGILSPLYGVY